MVQHLERSAAYQAGPSRREHAKKTEGNSKTSQDYSQQIFDDFDVSKTGLDRSELQKFINAYCGNDGVESSEVEWILAMADRDHSGRVSLDEMNRVRASLAAYMRVKKDLRVLFSKYDKNRNGMLDRAELHSLLEELNDNLPVQEEEVDWIVKSMGKTDSVNLMVYELEKAINFWYNNVEAPPQPVKPPIVNRSNSDVHKHVSNRHEDQRRSADRNTKTCTGQSRHDNHNARKTGSQAGVISMQRFDDFNNSGDGSGLDRTSLKRMIDAMSCQDAIDDSEVDWILAIADMDTDGKVSKDELKIFQGSLNNYLQVRKKLRPLFKRHDKNQNALLDRSELQSLLTELNDGIPVPKADVDFVLSHAGKTSAGNIVQPEIEQAINFWYSNVHPPKATEPPKDRRKGGAVGRAVSGHHHHPRQEGSYH